MGDRATQSSNDSSDDDIDDHCHRVRFESHTRWKSHILPKFDEAVIRELEEADTNEENSLWKSSSSRRGFRQNANYFTVE